MQQTQTRTHALTPHTHTHHYIYKERQLTPNRPFICKIKRKPNSNIICLKENTHQLVAAQYSKKRSGAYSFSKRNPVLPYARRRLFQILIRNRPWAQHFTILLLFDFFTLSSVYVMSNHHHGISSYMEVHFKSRRVLIICSKIRHTTSCCCCCTGCCHRVHKKTPCCSTPQAD